MIEIIKKYKKELIIILIIILILLLIIGLSFTYALDLNGNSLSSSNLRYDNSNSGLSATNAQDAVEELANMKCKKGELLTTCLNRIVSISDEVVDDGTNDHNLRYIGANPNNYITFNGEPWRIIGLMNNIGTNESGSSTGSFIKIIRDDSLGYFYWDYKCDGVGTCGSNDWSDSQLMIMLNPEEVYLNSANNTTLSKNGSGIYTSEGTKIMKNGSGYWERKSSGGIPAEVVNGGENADTFDFSTIGLMESARGMIQKVRWNLGMASSTSVVSTMYTNERGTTVSSGRPASWFGYVGLMYPSDYGYATGGGSTKTRSECLSYSLGSWNGISYQNSCAKSSWLFYPLNQYTLMPCGPSYIFGITFYGYVSNNGNLHGATMMVRPVLYLKSTIKVTGGNGLVGSPYTIE